MMSRGNGGTPRQERKRKSKGKDKTGATGAIRAVFRQSVSAAIRDQPAAVASAKPRLFQPGAIKQLFRDVRATLTPPAPAPEPKPKRRKDTGRAFRMTAKKIMRRASRIPAAAYATATAYLSDTLDWLNLWHHHDEVNEDIQPAHTDYLYPHL
jgi:hypothetical protein